MKKATLVLMLLLISFGISTINSHWNIMAAAPSESHNANAMWIEPSTVELPISTVPVGYKFNVTVWANCSVSCGGWQFWLAYENSTINAVRTGYTGLDGSKSDFFQNVSTIPVSPSFRGHNATFNRVEFGESWGGSGNKRDPGYGSLSWIEFNVISVPASTREVALEFLGVTGSVRRTYLINAADTSKVDLNAYAGRVRFVGEVPTRYTLTITATTGGTTDPAPGEYSYAAGSGVSVRATASMNYRFDHWELDQTNIGAANPTVVTMNTNHGLHAVFVQLPPPPPPPSGKLFDVQWTNWTFTELGNPFGGNDSYDNGEYPVWKNFTILYNGADRLNYISVKYPETTPSFKPSRYEIRVFPMLDSFNVVHDWTIIVNLEDRLVEFIAGSGGGIGPKGYAVVSVEFIQGPTAEDCLIGHEFAVTVSEITTAGQTFYLKEYIDKTAPQVEITFPDARTPGGLGYAFKKKDGYIWVQMPNCTNANIRWLWINGTASDACSGIDRVEIWINNTYVGDATLSERRGSKNVRWWWFVDPTKNIPQGLWEIESWYNVTARAYDNSVNDEHLATGHSNLPQTNYNDDLRWFFWIGEGDPMVRIREQWVPGNGAMHITGVTGFYPNGEVEIWLENELYGVKQSLTKVTASNTGKFEVTINHLPEVPRKPTIEDHWIIRAIDIKNNAGSDHFAIIPWITYEDTLAQDNQALWDTTKKGNVFDSFWVYGHGFLPSRQSNWDPYSTVYVEIVYTDVAPLMEWSNRRVLNGTSESNWDILEWYPRLSEVVLAAVSTDARGYWKALITIPQSYGGLHAIYAREARLVTDVNMLGPKTGYVLVRSGWPQSTRIEAEEQAVIFDVWPTIIISPSTALTNQYVTITCEGLPLPKYYKLWKNGRPIVENRDQCLVLDFGPCKQWVFENKRIFNNELDLAWVMELWYPFSYYSPDIRNYLNSPVWAGKLSSVTIDHTTNKLQFHIGSQYLRVPVLPADQYKVKVYYFDKYREDFTYDHDASKMENVLKDPLNVKLEAGTIHYPGEIVGVFVQTDVDGIAADVDTLTLTLYKGTASIKSIDYTKIDTGAYSATFACPEGDGDFFIKASVTKGYETFTLYGSAVTAFTISPTINELKAKLIALDGKIATLSTEVGQMRMDLSAVNATVTGIAGKLVTIETNVGTLQADISSIGGKIVAIQGKVATIETSIGTVRTDVSSISATIIGLHDDVVTVHTEVGNLQTKLKDLNGLVTIENDIAKIKTDLGDLQGKVVSLQGDTATIKTDLGTVTTKADTIQGNVGLQPVTIGLSLVAALAAIAAAVLILRKVYVK